MQMYANERKMKGHECTLEGYERNLFFLLISIFLSFNLFFGLFFLSYGDKILTIFYRTEIKI